MKRKIFTDYNFVNLSYSLIVLLLINPLYCKKRQGGFIVLTISA